MTGIGKKLLVWFLICSVIFAAHAFLARMMYLEITSIPEPGETIEGCLLITWFLGFPLSLFTFSLATVFEGILNLNNAPPSELAVSLSLFLLSVGTLNWILLILIVRWCSFQKIISLCLLLGTIVGSLTLTIDGFVQGFDFGHFVLLCACMYWSFWAGFVLSVLVRCYTNIRAWIEK